MSYPFIPTLSLSLPFLKFISDRELPKRTLTIDLCAHSMTALLALVQLPEVVLVPSATAIEEVLALAQCGIEVEAQLVLVAGASVFRQTAHAFLVLLLCHCLRNQRTGLVWKYTKTLISL